MTLSPLLRSSQSRGTQPDELCLTCCDGHRKQPQLLLGAGGGKVASKGSGPGRSTERETGVHQAGTGESAEVGSMSVSVSTEALF